MICNQDAQARRGRSAAAGRIPPLAHQKRPYCKVRSFLVLDSAL
jgi:hypothetical protein